MPRHINGLRRWGKRIKNQNNKAYDCVGVIRCTSFYEEKKEYDLKEGVK